MLMKEEFLSLVYQFEVSVEADNNWIHIGRSSSYPYRLVASNRTVITDIRTHRFTIQPLVPGLQNGKSGNLIQTHHDPRYLLELIGHILVLMGMLKMVKTDYAHAIATLNAETATHLFNRYQQLKKEGDNYAR